MVALKATGRCERDVDIDLQGCSKLLDGWFQYLEKE